MKKFYVTLFLSMNMCVMTFAAVAPKSAVRTNPPKTTVVVSHPKTSVSVTRPETSVTILKPTTKVEVLHPKTPLTVDGKPQQQGAQPSKKAVDNTGQAGNEKKGSMMSSYNAPKAKDLKAASLGGEQGMGNKINQSEKDQAAAQFKKPEALTWQNAINKNGISSSSIRQKIENKAK